MNRIKKFLGSFPVLLLLFLPGCKEEDPKNTISGFTIENYQVGEGDVLKTLTVNVQVKGAIGVEVSVAYTIKEGTAKFNQDIKESTGELKFIPNQSTSELSFNIIGDQNLELTETFDVVLTYENKDYPITIEISDDDSMGDILVADDGFYTGWVPVHAIGLD